ncbi:MAG: UDP-N-acetylmuramate dehydrogenase [Candidatus Aminicenantes bacterium]|nr:MAG: UDP-N-acetylmuramate dehydrogenase [Candidatus Aminicenantes bacterium]
MENQDLKTFLEEKKIQYHQGAGIKPYVTMGIGGTVQMVIVVFKEAHLKELLIHLHQNQYKYILLGGGSNVIFSDDFSGFIVVINRTSGIGKEGGDLLKVNSGVPISDLMNWTIRHNIGGMDFLAGIPGTIGGAAAVNAGAFGQSISAILEKAEIITQTNEIKTVDNDYFDFSYRNSRFKYSDEVILDVFLRFTYVPGDQIKEKVDANTRYRRGNHPCSGHGSAGCFFKNPVIDGKKVSAGQLIEQSGFKGTIYKALQVSDAHANFILNSGNASFADIQELEKKIVQAVWQKKGVQLEREVIYISPDGRKY